MGWEDPERGKTPRTDNPAPTAAPVNSQIPRAKKQMYRGCFQIDSWMDQIINDTAKSADTTVQSPINRKLVVNMSYSSRKCK